MLTLKGCEMDIDVIKDILMVCSGKEEKMETVRETAANQIPSPSPPGRPRTLSTATR